MNVQIYLFFDGNCEEAIELYRQALGAKVEYLMRYQEGPPELMPVGGEEKIFHATLRIADTLVNVSDDLKGEHGRSGGFALLVHLDTDSEAEAVFKAFSEGGKVFLPMHQPFWASRYGIVTDRFGVTWKVQSD